MTNDPLREKLANVLVVFLLLILTLVCMVQEGYLIFEEAVQLEVCKEVTKFCLKPGTDGRIFWLTLAAGFLFAFWLALSISTRRLVSLVFATLIIEYCSQTIGTRLGLWTYPISGGHYFFGILLWVVTVLFAYTGATKSVVKLSMMSKFRLPNALNPLILIGLIVVIWFAGPKIIKDISDNAQSLNYTHIFWSFIAILGLIGIIASLQNDSRIIMGIIISAWIVALISESSGAAAGIWKFLTSSISTSPPVYLIVGCWPLEILAIFSLSAFFAGEPLIPLATAPGDGGGSQGSGFSGSNLIGGGLESTPTDPQRVGDNSEEISDRSSRAADVVHDPVIPPHPPGTGGSPHKSYPEITDDERVLKIFLLLSSITYLVVGIIFLLKPGCIIQILEHVGTWEWEWKDFSLNVCTISPAPESRFWVTMTFSMMMTIAFLAYYAQRDIRNNKLYVVPLLIAKMSSALSAFLYFVFVKSYFPFLAIFVVDGAIVLVTVHFFLRACSSFLHEQTIFFWKHADIQKLSEPTLVASFKGDNKLELLDKVLEASKFFEALEQEYEKVRNASEEKLGPDPDLYYSETAFSKDQFIVAIKPNFMFMHAKEDISTYTDPDLVEHLVDRLCEHDYRNITIVESQSTLGNYYANRDVRNVAEIIGLTGKTKRGHNSYRIADLTLEMVPHNYMGRLGMHYAGLSWKNAHFRISFAKNKTHTFCGYTLALKNIYGTLPLQDKLKHYHTEREYDWPTIETMKPENEGGFPVHFALIDAYVSADGQFGVMVDPEPNWTKTIIGGSCPIAVDEVGCRKMGLDPQDVHVGRFYHLAVKMFGKPQCIWLGDQSVYEPWENVSETYMKSLDLIEEDYHLSDWGFSVLSACSSAFPFKTTKSSVLFLRWLLKPLKRMYYRYDAL